MEKAILKTIIYADIFDYPLKIKEIQKWLIGRKASIRQVEKALKIKKEYCFLAGRGRIVAKRRLRERNSKAYLSKARLISNLFKLIPWIKLTGISGGLALNNASKKDDIDMFIITAKNRLWLCRFLILGLLSLTGQRRKRQDSGSKIAGKICVNILLEEDKLEQKSRDIFVAHEVLQMRPLWERDGIYSKYLSDNSWAFKFLPNWITDTKSKVSSKHSAHNAFFDIFEKLAKKLQFMIMKSPEGMERIEDGALYFHPNDIREEILRKYNQSLTSSASFGINHI